MSPPLIEMILSECSKSESDVIIHWHNAKELDKIYHTIDFDNYQRMERWISYYEEQDITAGVRFLILIASIFIAVFWTVSLIVEAIEEDITPILTKFKYLFRFVIGIITVGTAFIYFHESLDLQLIIPMIIYFCIAFLLIRRNK